MFKSCILNVELVEMSLSLYDIRENASESVSGCKSERESECVKSTVLAKQLKN